MSRLQHIFDLIYMGFLLGKDFYIFRQYMQVSMDSHNLLYILVLEFLALEKKLNC